MSCYSYNFKDIMASCQVSNGGVRRLTIVDRAQILEFLGEGKGIEPKMDADGNYTIEFNHDAIAAIFKKDGGKYVNAFKLNPKKNTLEIQSTLNDQGEFEHTITPVNIGGASKETHSMVQALMDNDSLILAETRDGMVLVLGYDTPVSASAIQYNSGIQVTDANQHAVTLFTRSTEALFEGTDKDTQTNLISNAEYQAFWA